MGYYRSGKAIYYKNTFESGSTEQVLIADAGDVEKAEFTLNRLNNNSSKFIPLAVRTCSPSFYSERVSMAQFKGRMNGAIDALNKLDQVKKSLFYGRDNNLITEGQGDAAELPTLVDSNATLAIDVIHAILGIATEAGELLEALRNAYNGNGLDWVNLKEEYGDLAWYEALLAKSGDYEFEEVWQLIIKKLTARYPDKYADALANGRDLETERSILEGSMQDEGDLLTVPKGETIPEGYMPVMDLDGDKEAIPYKIYNPLRDENGNTIIEPVPSQPLNLEPTPPAGGKANVEAAEAKADTAFANVDKVQADMVEPTPGNNSDLSKPRAYRNEALDDEHIAHQPVRREDLE